MKSLLACLVGLLIVVQVSPVSKPLVSGRVRLADGSPVVGAQVVLFDVAELRRGPVGQATTDEAGQFALVLAAGAALPRPSEVVLGPNYPNPFNPATIIPYQLSATSQVRLEVFNVLGQRVTTLVDDEQGAGSYQARWDGTDAAGGAAAAGLYLYRLTANGVQRTGKMVLLDGQAGVPLGGARVEAVPMAPGSAYGLVVAGAGLMAHVEADFGVEAGLGPVDIEVEAAPGRPKAVPASHGLTPKTQAGVLGDVNNDGRVEWADGLLVAMQQVEPALRLPNEGELVLGDVNCDGRIEPADAALIATYVSQPQDAAVAPLAIGQPGGYSLDPVTEMVWHTLIGRPKRDASVDRILGEVPVVMSGVLEIKGELYLYLGIDHDYWSDHGGKHIYRDLKERFPLTPLYVEPSKGVQLMSGRQRMRSVSQVPEPEPLRRADFALQFADAPNRALKDNDKQQRIVGQITVPDAITVGEVSVAVDISHPSRRDLKIDLVAPSGVATPLYDGIRKGIRPAADLIGPLPSTSSLAGQSAQGTWSLRIGDYERGDAGTLHSWNLTITPASEAPAGEALEEEAGRIFSDAFQGGSGAWQADAGWEARSLDRPAAIPGAAEGNIVAQAQGCDACFLTLQAPLDLQAHEQVTVSFWLYMDAGIAVNEYLVVDVGNNGTYKRLETFTIWDGDGQWRKETFTIAKQDLSEAFTLRFLAIANNDFTTFAIDDVVISGSGSGVDEPDALFSLADDAAQANLTVQTTATPASVESGDSITVRATITNTGTASASSQTVIAYRHTEATDNPRVGGTRIASGSTGTLAAGAQVRRSTRTAAPTVTSQTTYHYYMCVSPASGGTATDDNCSSAQVAVRPAGQAAQEEPDEQEKTPNLTVLTTATPASVGSGGTITVRATVTNTGAATASSQTVTAYRHDRATDTPHIGGTRIASGGTGTLPPAALVTRSTRTAAPTVTSQTTYHYYMCVTPASGETVTDDNCSSAQVIVTPGQAAQEEPDGQEGTPNLTIQIVTVTPASVESGEQITIRATIRNDGDAYIGSRAVRVYQHASETASPRSGSEVASLATGSLAAGVGTTRTLLITAPDVASDTARYYYACVDAFGEQRTDDNCSDAVQVQVRPRTQRFVLTATATQTAVESGDAITIQTTIENTGATSVSSQTITVYLHDTATNTPHIGGRRIASGSTGTLAAGAQVTRSTRTTAPTVINQTTYHYYVCVGRDCAYTQVTVTPEQVVRSPDYQDLDVMGGDPLSALRNLADIGYRVDTRGIFYSSGTVTLGGVTTMDGTKGLVLSGHAAVFSYKNPEDYANARNDTLLFGGWDERTHEYRFRKFLGKVTATPKPRQVGRFDYFFDADAAFAAYPSTAIDDCSLITWTNDDAHGTYCLDLGKGEQIETLTPLAIRGKNSTVYTVVGSKSPTIGLGAMFTGRKSGVVEGNRVTSGAILTRFTEDGGSFYSYDLSGGGIAINGDSGSPIYTIPDRDGDVHIIGILRGTVTVAGKENVNFVSWGDVMKELNLQPIQ